MRQYYSFILPQKDKVQTVLINKAYINKENIRASLNAYIKMVDNINKRPKYPIWDVTKQFVNPNDPLEKYTCMLTNLQ